MISVRAGRGATGKDCGDIATFLFVFVGGVGVDQGLQVEGVERDA